MNSPTPHLALGSNSIWLTFPSTPEKLLIRTYLLGLGADHSLLCALPEDPALSDLKCGISCSGRSCIDEDIYEFKTVIQEILTQPPTLRLTAPSHVSRQHPRTFPRLTVNMTGAVRPLSDKGRILAVLPVRFSNLSPTGCQFRVAPSAWPLVSSSHLHMSCRLPGFTHFSKFTGSIEWVDPTKELVIGTKFSFTSTQDPANQDILGWYTSQQAHLINTTA
ncbi:MAG: PilZ domain-containing protein [Nitrospira sp.]|nr:PilZ domain-containing protein [Nitrospira sp.]HNP30788.1 PilZ domain-containing protein [Nitrospirales bacterium]